MPLAVLDVAEAWQDPVTQAWRLAGPLEALRAPAHGPFHALRRRPDELAPAEGPLLAVATREALHRKQLGQLRQVAERLGAAVLVLPLLGGEHDESLVRALLGVRKELPDGARIVPVPLPARGDHDRDVLLRAHVAAAYGATHLLAEAELDGTAIPLVVPEPWAYDADVEVWRPVARIEPDHVQAELTAERLHELLDAGEPVPDWFTPPAVAAELVRARPPKHSRGITVFFTGLSGSGSPRWRAACPTR